MGDLPLRTPTHRRLGGPLPRRLANAPHAHPPPVIPLAAPGCPGAASRGIRRNFFRLSPCGGQVAYVLLTRAPVAGRRWQAITPAAPRLACVKPVASVHPEPGSNSSLLYLVSFFFFSESKKRQDAFMLSIPSRTLMPRRHGTNRHHRPLSNRLAELTEIFPPPGQARTARSLVLLRL